MGNFSSDYQLVPQDDTSELKRSVLQLYWSSSRTRALLRKTAILLKSDVSSKLTSIEKHAIMEAIIQEYERNKVVCA